MKEKETLIGAMGAPPVILGTAQVETASADALFDSTNEFQMVGGKRIPILYLKWDFEIKMLRLLAPYQKMLIDAAGIGELDAAIGAMLVEATGDLEAVACLILQKHFALLGIDAAPRTKQVPGESTITPAGLVEGPAVTITLTDEQWDYEQFLKIRSWLRTEAHFAEISELVLAQIKRNKLGESLGKLWAPGALHIKALRILSTLESRVMPD